MTMATVMSLAAVKAHLSDLVGRVHAQHERITITVHGRLRLGLSAPRTSGVLTLCAARPSRWPAEDVGVRRERTCMSSRRCRLGCGSAGSVRNRMRHMAM